MLPIAAGLAACATAPGQAPEVDLSAYALSELVIPDALPGPDAPLGLLRPDAHGVRDDVSVVLKSYPVTGSTADALLDDETGLRASARAAGLDYIARVDWRVTWRFDLETSRGLCRADDVSTRLRVTYRLPDWQPEADVSDALAADWAGFERDLWTHEYGHALIGYRTKQDIQTALSETALADPDCGEVSRTLNALGKAITARGLDADYDARTAHGRTQGATFDPRPSETDALMDSQ